MISNLKIRPVSCKIYSQNSEKIINPKFKILIGSTAETLRVGKNDENNITWEEELEIKQAHSKILHIEIWDPETNTLIGSAEKPLESANTCSICEWVLLKNVNNQEVGNILIEIECFSEDADIELDDQFEGIPKHMLPHETYFDLQSKLQRFLRNEIEVTPLR